MIKRIIRLKDFFYKSILMVFVFGSFCNAFSQAPSWEWAKRAGGTNQDRVAGSCTDVSGNVFVTGKYNSPSITFGTTTLINAGDYDIFIVKYDSYGNVLWAKSIGGNADDMAHGITTDANGNVIVTGFFLSSSINFGTISLTTGAGSNMFVVKYDNSGNVIWAKSAVGNNSSGVDAWSVCTDAGGNVYVAGSFRNFQITFGTITLHSYPGSYPEDFYILKYDSSGNLHWAKSGGGTAGDMPNSVCVDANGNIIIGGYFFSSIMVIDADTLYNASGGTVYCDIFIVKYDAAGNLLSAKSEGGNYNDFATGVSADANGNAYVTGYFQSDTIIIGTDTIIPAFSGSAYSTVFTAKYDNSGNVLWAKCPIGVNSQAFDIATDAGNNVIVTGYFLGSSIIFGFDTLNYVSTSGSHIFVVKYDYLGNVLWAKSGNGNSSYLGSSVSVDAGGNVYVSGDFFGTTIFDSDTLINAGAGDLFVAKLGLSTGISSLQSSSLNFQLFPNPTSGNVEITFSNFYKVLNSVKIEVINVMGEKVTSPLITLQSRGKSSSSNLNLSFLAKGIYVLQVWDGLDRVNKKLVIE